MLFDHTLLNTYCHSGHVCIMQPWRKENLETRYAITFSAKQICYRNVRNAPDCLRIHMFEPSIWFPLSQEFQGLWSVCESRWPMWHGVMWTSMSGYQCWLRESSCVSEDLVWRWCGYCTHPYPWRSEHNQHFCKVCLRGAQWWTEGNARRWSQRVIDGW